MNSAIIIRDLSQFGGGEYNVVCLIEALNKRGITPAVFSENQVSADQIKHYFNKEVQYTHKPFPRPQNNLVRVLAEIFLPHPLKNKLNEFDFIFDFTNKPPVLRNAKNYIKYLYIISDERALNQSFLRNAQAKLYNMLAKLGFLKFNKFAPGVTNITQSQFTQQEIKQKTDHTAPIIYPPVDTTHFSPNTEKKEQVVTLGRFSPEKNQLEQLEIAKKLPDLQFILIGKVDDKNYTEKLKQKIKSKNINNATLVTDASKDDVKKYLEESKYFLSTVQEEHFGIAIAESIAAGCTPFSHNSGGPIEIIQNQELLFNTSQEAAEKIKNLQNIQEEKQQKIQTNLQKNIQKFSEENFTKQLLSHIK